MLKRLAQNLLSDDFASQLFLRTERVADGRGLTDLTRLIQEADDALLANQQGQQQHKFIYGGLKAMSEDSPRERKPRVPEGVIQLRYITDVLNDEMVSQLGEETDDIIIDNLPIEDYSVMQVLLQGIPNVK